MEPPKNRLSYRLPTIQLGSLSHHLVFASSKIKSRNTHKKYIIFRRLNSHEPHTHIYLLTMPSLSWNSIFLSWAVKNCLIHLIDSLVRLSVDSGQPNSLITRAGVECSPSKMIHKTMMNENYILSFRFHFRIREVRAVSIASIPIGDNDIDVAISKQRKKRSDSKIPYAYPYDFGGKSSFSHA